MSVGDEHLDELSIIRGIFLYGSPNKEAVKLLERNVGMLTLHK